MSDIVEQLENATRRAEYWKLEHIAANAEIDSLRQQLAECQARVQEPEGWRLVPIEPTSEMIVASVFHPVCATLTRRHIYQAMLLSAPKFKAKELE
jgi:hypothetical protein